MNPTDTITMFIVKYIIVKNMNNWGIFLLLDNLIMTLAWLECKGIIL